MASPPNLMGSSHGSPVSAAVASMIRRASTSSAISDVLRATATTRDGATSAATVSCAVMNGRSSAIGNRASGRWSKSWSAMPGLWTITIAWGVAPWMSPTVTLL